MSPLSSEFLMHAQQYFGYGLEGLICLLLVSGGKWRNLKGLLLYVAGLFLLDGVARPAVLNHFGRSSVQFAYFYWLTDVVLATGAFLLTCGFFRRACKNEERLWRFVRMFLVFVFLVVIAVSALSLTRHYTQLYTVFIVEFSQNLYFSCLVLNTMLFVMIQQLAIEDDELGLLVCGMGLQFAGEAAGLALLHLTSGENFARILFAVLNPACTMGMLLTWTYAIVKTPTAETRRAPAGEKPALVEAVAD